MKKRKKKTLADVKVRIPLPQKPPKVETPSTVYKRSRDKKVPEEEQEGEDNQQCQ